MWYVLFEYKDEIDSKSVFLKSWRKFKNKIEAFAWIQEEGKHYYIVDMYYNVK